MLKPELDAAFRALIDQDICFDALVLTHHLKQFRELLARYPDLQVIVDHGAKPKIAEGLIDDWAADMKAIAQSGARLLQTLRPGNGSGSRLDARTPASLCRTPVGVLRA